MTPAEDPILETLDLTRHYGGVTALSHFSMRLHAGRTVGLIGPNGAGKTTVFNLITGLDRPDSGRVIFRGRDITTRPAHVISRLGIARTFQNIRLLGHLSVLDNVKIAYHPRAGYGLVSAVLRLRRYRRREREIARRSMEFLEMFALGEQADEPASSLPYGKRRNLEIARALATEGSVLLLDEPAAGLNTQETADLSDLVRRVTRELGVTVLLIEHDMSMVMRLCEQVIVLDHGNLIACGTAEQVRRDEKVLEAYLGKVKEPPSDDAGT